MPPSPQAVADRVGLPYPKLMALYKAFRPPASRDTGPGNGEPPAADDKAASEAWVEEMVEEDDPAELAHHRMMKEDLNHVLLTLTERECGIIKVRAAAAAARGWVPWHGGRPGGCCQRPRRARAIADGSTEARGPSPARAAHAAASCCTPRRHPQMRYGLDDGQEKTLEEVGRAFNVSAALCSLLSAEAPAAWGGWAHAWFAGGITQSAAAPPVASALVGPRPQQRGCSLTCAAGGTPPWRVM